MPHVTVGCKMPNGLILRIFTMAEKNEQVMGGGSRKIKEAVEVPGKRVVLNGFSHPQNAAPRARIAGGFALTMGVDKEFWDTWLAQNKDTDIVRNGLVFAHEKVENTTAEAKDKQTLRSGLERLDPKKLPKGIKQSDMMPKAPADLAEA